MRLLRKSRFRFLHGQRGFTLIETLVGVAIFAAIGVALMSGLSTGYKSMGISQERTYAEGMAKSQVEYIKDQDYISVGNYGTGDPLKLYGVITIPAHLTSAGYAVEISVSEEPIEPAGVSGYEIQGITIKVTHHGSGKFVIVLYRVGLAL